MNDKILYRYSKPNNFDELPRGTIIHVVNDEFVDVYEQTNDEESNPNWTLVKSMKKI